MRNQRTLSAGCNLWDFDVSNATVKTASDWSWIILSILCLFLSKSRITFWEEQKSKVTVTNTACMYVQTTFPGKYLSCCHKRGLDTQTSAISVDLVG
jgi:hypothetical protein